MIAALRTGLASLVIDRSGYPRFGIWGASVPPPGEAVYSVRQNLQPLVYRGQPTAAAAIPGCGAPPWAAACPWPAAPLARTPPATSLRREHVRDARRPGAGAGRRGARIAMELDINPEWVQLDIARAPGGPLIAAIPGQDRPASQFLAGWTRDFTVLAAPTS